MVQQDQEALVASAWDQLGDIRKANQMLRQAQLARQAAASMYKRHLDRVAGDGAYLQITGPVHGRVRVSNLTMRGEISASRLPVRAVSAAMRKMARPRGPLGRQLALSGAPQIVDRLNLPAGQAKAVTPAGPAQRPQGMVALDDISPAIQVAKMTPTAVHNVGGWIASAVISTTGGTLTEASAQPTTPAAPGGVAGLHTAVSAADHTLVNAGGTARRVPEASRARLAEPPRLQVAAAGICTADYRLERTRRRICSRCRQSAGATGISLGPDSVHGDAESFQRWQAVGAYVGTAAIQFSDPPPLAESPSLRRPATNCAQLDPS